MKTTLLAASLVTSLALTGCSTLMCAPACHHEERNASSLVDFLYPNGELPPKQIEPPVLHLPLRVGLAFLPPHGRDGATILTDAQKMALLEQVRQRFVSRKFVADITVIPDYYLAGRNGPESLAAAQRLYGTDVIALVSYDQVAWRDDNKWSLGYLTIVGAYVLKGTHHDISTLVDLAVIDPATRTLVLRAGGADTQRGNSTLVEEGRETRALRVAGFTAATEQMIGNFDAALTQFEHDVRDGKSAVRVVNAHGGGGAFDWMWIALLAGAVGLRVRLRHPHAPPANFACRHAS